MVQTASMRGFTLIEISIVLVIIGLLVGGVLVGKDLINAAGVQAQITQIEKYNQAVNTFKAKYNALPGDINAADAAQFGFAARGWGTIIGYAGAGDGNGIIEGSLNVNDPAATSGYATSAGEPVLFWVDLAAVTGESRSLSAGCGGPGVAGNGKGNPCYLVTNIDTYLPAAKLGAGNYIYVWSGGGNWTGNALNGGNGINYFGLAAVTSGQDACFTSHPGTTVRQAYAIDSKIDDGLPQSGNVSALYVTSTPTWLFWAAGGGGVGASGTSATPGSATTCYDNGNVSGAVQQYSITQNNGTGMNCALSFQFQ